MKQIVVLSGKGGTGKTSVAAILADRASQANRVVLVDADADAANLGLLLAPRTVEDRPFYGADLAVVDAAECLVCGACIDVCRFNALSLGETLSVDPVACEGCGACVLECAVGALTMETVRAGSELHAETTYGPLFHGDLYPGEENSGKLVAALGRSAVARAEAMAADFVLIDGPPGIGCPAIAASTGADAAVLVTEPSASALSDLERILGLLRHFGVPAVACLNKADLHAGAAERIRTLLRSEGVPLVCEIPYHAGMQAAVAQRRPASPTDDPTLMPHFDELWDGVRQLVEGAAEPPVARPTSLARFGSP